MTDSLTYRNDLEESDESLEANYNDPVNFWEQKQRELLTSVVDYNLSGLSDLIVDEVINLDPSYQRRLRWDIRRQSRLIESFLMNVPVPPIFLNEDDYGAYSVIDGKQRITAISDFMRGRLRLEGLKVFHELNGMSIDDLPKVLRRILRTRPTLRAIIILRQSDDEVKFNVFERLNTGGVKLNAQEIRNSAFPGPLNKLVIELSTHREFHELLGIKNRAKSKVYQEMRDAELVLRFFAFKDNWQVFSGGMKRHMDSYMKDNQRISSSKASALEEEFLLAIRLVESAFGPVAFRRWQPERTAWRKQVLAALYDAQMFGLQGYDPSLLKQNQPKIVEGLKSLFSNDDFRSAIDSATNAPTSFRKRISIINNLVENALQDG